MTPLLTIEDLAERWGMTTGRAWTVVREEGVPFISLSSKKSVLTGKGPRPGVKFRAETVERWEREREGKWVEPVIERVPSKIQPRREKANQKVSEDVRSAWEFLGMTPPE